MSHRLDEIAHVVPSFTRSRSLLFLCISPCLAAETPSSEQSFGNRLFLVDQSEAVFSLARWQVAGELAPAT